MIDTLLKLNFTKLEAEIYLALLGAEPMSAYQLAKKIEMSRPAIYNALEHMLEKGMVEMIPEQTALYQAQKPQILLGKMETEIESSIKEAKKKLKQYEETRTEERTIVFKGFETGIHKAKDMLKDARKEVFINADFDLLCLEDELKELKKRAIRVVVFSFYDIKIPEDCVECYSHNRVLSVGHVPSRFMLVVDGKTALVSDGNAEGKWNGTYTNNGLTVKILLEHIHNDVYLLKLKEQYGKEIYGQQLFLNTEFERENRAVQ